MADGDEVYAGDALVDERSPDAPPVNPVDLENKLLDAMNRLALGLPTLNDLLIEHEEAQLVYDTKFAVAFNAAPGPQTGKRYHATVDPDVIAARRARNTSYTKLMYARDRKDALERRISVLQSMLKAIVPLYQAVGVGQR